jgi:thymidylate synthase
MLVIRARNVNDAMPKALQNLGWAGIKRESRAGTVIEYPEPVATVYQQPRERVLFNPHRDANPFFHFFEALWVLAGRGDVGFLARFNVRMREFSDNGKTFHAPYGRRLRSMARKTIDVTKGETDDQVSLVCKMLRDSPQDRRAVLQIWDAGWDLGASSKDIPCNDMVFCKRGPEGELNIRVCCRSNDAVWGAYGANAVQFSVLQEYMAAHIGCPVGTYTQISDSLHVYMDNPFWDFFMNTTQHGATYDAYQVADVQPFPLFTQPKEFDADLLVKPACTDTRRRRSTV